MAIRRLVPVTVLIASLAALLGCNWAGWSPTDGVTVTPGPLIASEVAAQQAESEEPDVEAEAWAFLDRINDYRQSSEECWSGRTWNDWPREDRSLVRSAELDRASRRHNDAMIATFTDGDPDTGCFAHQCPGEPDTEERLHAVLPGLSWGSENIAAGFATAERVFQGWRRSTGHDQTMLACQARSIGIDFQWVADAEKYDGFWTTDFSDLSGTEVEVNEPRPAGLSRFDADGDCVIDNRELFSVIDEWSDGSVRDETLFAAIDAWVAEEAIC